MTNTASATNTPGYSIRLTVRFKTDRNGRVRATRYSPMNGRWFPVPVTDAEMWISQDLANRA